MIKEINAVIILLAVACSGCATTKTVSVVDKGIISNRYWNSTTNCSSLPRVYSGLAHNACFALFAARSNGAIYNSFETGVYVLDSMASVVGDTLVLPYTIYTQYQWGSIEVGEHGK